MPDEGSLSAGRNQLRQELDYLGGKGRPRPPNQGLTRVECRSKLHLQKISKEDARAVRVTPATLEMGQGGGHFPDSWQRLANEGMGRPQWGCWS